MGQGGENRDDMKVEGEVGNLVNGEPRKFKPKEVGNQV